MPNYALVKNNEVQNVIIAEPDFLEVIKADWDEIIEVTDPFAIAIGYKKVKNKWTAPVQEPASQPTAAASASQGV